MEKRKGRPPTKPSELKDGFYLELRNKKSLNISKKIKGSKLFVAYYLKNIRLIDNI